ncbi:MAG: sulfatase-like hydrolase/transferase [Luteolibacter sp.]
MSIFKGLALPLVSAALMVTAEAAAPPKPNILLIVADDLGYGDLGCFGSKDIPTPHIDGLAHQGVKFTDAHAYNVCSPTRASLRTGCYAERNGVRTVLMGGNVPGFAKATTLASKLHEAGYATGLVGKWHLGYSGDVVPTRMGYDEFFGFHGGKLDYFKHTDSTQKNGTPEGKHDLWEGEKEVFRTGYTTDLFSERAVQFIRDHAKQPFYLELSYNAPHYSTEKGVYQAPEAYLKKFHVEGSPDNTRGGYAAMVNCMDDGIGRVLAELTANKLDEKTLVIFVSDNGAEASGSNGALSGGKHNNKEGGIRVPWVARWPGVIPADSTRADVVHVMDLAPTLLSLAQPPDAPKPVFDGINIWSAFTGGGKIADRPICFPKETIRSGQWKLNAGKLYDLDKDPRETTDVAAAHPEIRDQLAKQLATWQQAMDIKVKEKEKKED